MFCRNTFKSYCFLLLFVGVVLVFTPNTRAQQIAGSGPLDRIAWIVGQWTAAEEPVNGNAFLSELVAKWSSDHSTIQVTCSHLSGDQKSIPVYTATYTWDPGMKKITVKQTFANGDKFDGAVTSIGTDFEETGKLVHANGSTQNIQMTFDSWADATFNLTVQAQGQNSPSAPANAPLVYLRQTPATSAAAGAAELSSPPK